ncbi:MAG: histidine triad nucleotide-binding protein [Clostridiales bacterium]|nr:histidine triad nucleotide-binding protein [Clostridia bacterium]MCR4564363.1 histidine triad nucleotide-binding protein [Clostridiales bacterium]
MDCIFCKIVNGEIPSSKVYEDDKVYAFNDINPQSDRHILVIPKEHICCANRIDETNSSLVAHIFEVIPKIAAQEGLEFYRIINNCGEKAGQTVMHLHFHILSGENLGERLV